MNWDQKQKQESFFPHAQCHHLFFYRTILLEWDLIPTVLLSEGTGEFLGSAEDSTLPLEQTALMA